MKCFHCRFLSEAGQTFALVCGFGALRVFFLLHVMVFPMGEKLYAQVVNLRSLMHSLVGIISTVIAGMGFGKPYSPIMVYTFGFILNSIVSLIMLGMPGLFDWVDKYIPMISCFVLYAEYVCRGR